jgi:predicted dehydrogenase
MHRVLVIGVGSIGERHTRCFLATDRASVAICEPADAIRESVAERYPIEAAYASLDAALSDEWDAVVIATPAHTHVPIARQVTATETPFLLEKPFSTSLDGVDALLEEVRAKNLIAGVAYNYRVHPALAAMKDAIDAGRFGKPLQMCATLGQDFEKYRPAYREVYFADRARGGGAIQDAITHFFNAGEWVAGPMDRIVVDAAHQHLDGVEVEDTVHALARHGDILASYTLNMYQKANESILTMICEGGMARFEVHNQRWRWMDETEGGWHEEPHPMAERDTWYIRQADMFLDVIEGKSDVPCTLEEGVHTLRVNLAALKSWDTGAWVDVDGDEP